VIEQFSNKSLASILLEKYWRANIAAIMT